MKRSIAFAAALSLFAASGCTLAIDSEPVYDTESADSIGTGSFFSRLPGFVAIGASITFGIGASDPATTGSTALFADYLEQVHFQREIDFLNLAVPGATSEDILKEQSLDATVFSLKHMFQQRVIWVASGGNDLLALIDPVVLQPCFAPPEVPALGVSFGCFDVFRNAATAYEENLRKTLKPLAVSAHLNNAVLMARTEIPSLDEENCAIDGAIDQFGEIFIPAEQIGSLRQLADLALEGQVPAIPELGFEAYEGFNVIMRRVVAEMGERYNVDAVIVDPFIPFKVAASQGGDLVTRDCVHPNDAGHALIRDIAVAAFEAR